MEKLEVQDRSFRSGELARSAGVSSDTLRHYERLGILPRPPRAPNGYRSYPPEAARRVRLIRSAMDVGFTLAELARVLKVRDAGGAPCRTVRELAARKLLAVETQIAQLRVFRADLQRVLLDWDRRLAEAPPGRRVGLLDALEESMKARPLPVRRIVGRGVRKPEPGKEK